MFNAFASSIYGQMGLIDSSFNKDINFYLHMPGKFLWVSGCYNTLSLSLSIPSPHPLSFGYWGLNS